MEAKYFVLEDIENDPLNKRVIEATNLGKAYKLWLESPSSRVVVKEIQLEVKEIK